MLPYILMVFTSCENNKYEFPAPNHVSFRKYSNLNFRVFINRNAAFSSLTISSIKIKDVFMRTYASSWVKRKSFSKKSELHTKLYNGAWNVSANNSETVGHKELRFGQIVYILVFFLASSTGRFSIYFFVPCLLRDSENKE